MYCTASLTFLEPVFLSVLRSVSRPCVGRRWLHLLVACSEDVLQPALLFFHVSFGQRHRGDERYLS